MTSMRQKDGGADPGRLSRRNFLCTTTVAAAAAAAAGWRPETADAAAPGPLIGATGPRGLVDTNVWLGQWPGRRLPLEETPALVARLRRQGVRQAWAGSFDGLWHKDLGAVNARLAAECRRQGRGLLTPFGTINPADPAWEEDLRRCAEEHQMPGIRLHPNYHGYQLDDPALARLLDRAGQRGLIVQLVAAMEDERTQHPRMRVPQVDVAPLAALLASRPELRLVLLNWGRGVNSVQPPRLAEAGQICFDIATLEGVGGVASLLRQVPADRVVFGSCAPLFYLESALLKLQESPLTEAQLAAVRADNALRLRRRIP